MTTFFNFKEGFNISYKEGQVHETDARKTNLPGLQYLPAFLSGVQKGFQKSHTISEAESENKIWP